MVDEHLRIIIEAVDNASDDLGKVSGSMSSLGKVAGKAAMAGLAVGAAAAGASALVLGKGLSYAVQEAMAAEEITAQLDAVIRSTGGAAGVTAQSANDLATSLSQMTRYDDEAVLGAESLMLTFTHINSQVFPETIRTVLDMSTAMGQDLQTSAIQVGKALNNPAEGLSALQRVGVTFTAEQEEMIKGMVAAGDVMGAQKAILAELAKEFGGSAAAAGGTFAGQLDILKNNLNNIAETVGAALLPALTSLAGQISEFVQSDEFQAWARELADWLATKLPQAIQATASFWTTQLQPAIEKFWPVLKNDVIPAITTIFNILGTVAPPILAAFVKGWEIQIGIFNAVKTAIQNMLIPFEYLFNKLKELRNALSNLELPDWLKPGSPTPLELGLVGINRAMDELSGKQLSFAPQAVGLSYAGGGMVQGGYAAGGGGSGRTVIVNFNQPVIGFADRYELARELGPIIRDYLAGHR